MQLSTHTTPPAGTRTRTGTRTSAQTQRGADPVSLRNGNPRRRYIEVRRILAVVLVLNLAVAAAKIVFGWRTGSLAMTADGFHSTLDGLSNVIAIVGLMAAARPPDPNHAYGHHRFETLTSLAIAAMMLLAVFGLLSSAWSRASSGLAPEVHLMSFVVMLVTLSVNIGVTLWERNAGQRLSSSVLLADARHTASDLMVSLSVIASLVAVGLGVGRADAAVTVVIAFFIMRGAWQIVRDAVLVLSDAQVTDPELVARAVLEVPGVIGTHNVRTRGGDGVAWVDLHVQVEPSLRVDQAHDIASDVARVVEQAMEVPSDVTVHIEPADRRHLQEERGHDPLGHVSSSR